MGLLLRLKPVSSRKTRLLLAGLIWTVVGVGLLAAGVRWTLSEDGAWAWPGLALALAVGGIKGHFLLARRAGGNVHRILETEEDRCVGGVFSWGAWGFVAAMMVLGIVLRHSSIPRGWLGLIYSAAGSALVLASAVPWTHWVRLRRGIGASGG